MPVVGRLVYPVIKPRRRCVTEELMWEQFLQEMPGQANYRPGVNSLCDINETGSFLGRGGWKET